jgi:hypothetical protein
MIGGGRMLVVIAGQWCAWHGMNDNMNDDDRRAMMPNYCRPMYYVLALLVWFKRWHR